jgi:hypothetical protein
MNRWFLGLNNLPYGLLLQTKSGTACAGWAKKVALYARFQLVIPEPLRR